MGYLAQRLGKKCLRKGTVLEKVEVSAKYRLQALVRELLQKKMAGEDEKSDETLADEKLAIESIAKRVRRKENGRIFYMITTSLS